MVSVRRVVVPVLLLVVAIPAFGAARKSSSHPPRELHRVGDHWTPYNPPDPATWPAGAKTYTIKQGDTLWGLAQQFFKNAYMWPQLWESNTWITDAHWIYPGDVLLIDSEAVPIASAEANPSPNPNPNPGPTTAPQPGANLGSPVPLGTEADVYCYGYIGDPAEPMPNFIQAWEDAEMRYQPGVVNQDIGGASGDLVLLSGGTATGLIAGDTYMIVQAGDLVPHPNKRTQIVGREYLYSGQLRVLCADDHHARAIITQSCDDIRLGARLKPMPQIPIPLARIPDMPEFCDPASGKRNGYIVSAQGGWDAALGEGLLVEINLGQADQLQPGDFLTVYRDNGGPGDRHQVLGEVGILTTNTHTATGKIVAMRYSMKIGDRVEIR
ncbi:MAG TPA: LysM peptidoglycan-binding domain-containing protein [Thermoanaerobaculia bacterium]